jgi:hypothetical protein
MILPKLTSSNLISLGQLCDDDCEILLNKHEMKAMKNNKVILKGYRNSKDGLWDIPIPKTTITPKCCITPLPHPAIYSCRTLHAKCPSTKHTTTTTNITTVAPHLQHLGNLADNNHWDNEISVQNKRNLNHKVNVILRKNKGMQN